ncbi:MAG: TolC family protein [bacterium]
MKRFFASRDPNSWSARFLKTVARARPAAVTSATSGAADALRRRSKRAAAVLRRVGVSASVVCAALAIVSATAAAADVRLSLGDALSLAGTHALKVQAAAHDSLAAERALRAAKADWFPKVVVTGNALGLHPDDPLGLGFLQIPAEWHSIYAANLSLRYPIFTGGRRIHNIRRSREDLRAAGSQLDAERLRNAYECRTAYFHLLVADRLVAAAEASLRRVELIGTDVGNRFAAGLADSVDVLETEVSLRKAKRHLETTQNGRRNASATLARLIGTALNEPIIPTEPMSEPVKPSGANIPPADTTARPELEVLDRRLDALHQQRSVIKDAYLPVINGLGGYALVRPDLGQPGVSWQTIGFVGLSFSWDFNLGGQVSAQSGQVLQQIRSLEMTRQDAAQAFVLQARIARNNIDEAYRLYELSREEFNIAADQYRLAEGKMEAGALSVNRLVEIESDLAATEQEFEAARLRYFLAVTEYLYAIGSDSLWEAQ